jgi:hypothetical protein
MGRWITLKISACIIYLRLPQFALEVHVHYLNANTVFNKKCFERDFIKDINGFDLYIAAFQNLFTNVKDTT